LKKILSFLIIAVCLLCSCGGQMDKDGSKKDTVNLVLTISNQNRLYTTQYNVHKIVTLNDMKSLEGTVFGKKFSQILSLGDRRIAIPIDVTLQAYVDFAGFSEANVQRSGKKIRIILPDPRVIVTSSKVDNAGIKQQVGFFRSKFSDSEMTSYTQQGVASVIASAPEMGIIETARQSAAAVLIPLLVSCGFEEENIVISFRKEFTTEDIPVLYDNEGSVVKID